MEYLFCLVFDTILLVFVGYMVINVHPIWALMVIFLSFPEKRTRKTREAKEMEKMLDDFRKQDNE